MHFLMTWLTVFPKAQPEKRERSLHLVHERNARTASATIITSSPRRQRPPPPRSQTPSLSREPGERRHSEHALLAGRIDANQLGMDSVDMGNATDFSEGESPFLETSLDGRQNNSPAKRNFSGRLAGLRHHGDRRRSQGAHAAAKYDLPSPVTCDKVRVVNLLDLTKWKFIDHVGAEHGLFTARVGGQASACSFSNGLKPEGQPRLADRVARAWRFWK